MNCPICVTSAPEFHGHHPVVDCPRCGTFKITSSAIDFIGSTNEQPDEAIRRATVSHAIRQMQGNVDVPELNSDLISSILANTSLPGATELVNNLLVVMGDDTGVNIGGRLRYMGTKEDSLAARIGAVDSNAAYFALKQLDARGLVEDYNDTGGLGGQVTFSGWQEYERLKREVSESRIAFMAMPFNNDKLDTIYSECFRPALRDTGFDLRRIDQEAPAGSIDNRLRVEIRRSRFMIAELSEDNSGAYWEAGFAEGLGRPVIYTCHRDQKTHFDTRQMHTVFWEEDKLEEAAQRLKDTIRATLPAEAVLADLE